MAWTIHFVTTLRQQCVRQTINVYIHSHHKASKNHTSCHICPLDALRSQKTSYNNLNLQQQQLQDLRYLRVNGYASTYAAFGLSSDCTCIVCNEETVSKIQILKGSSVWCSHTRSKLIRSVVLPSKNEFKTVGLTNTPHTLFLLPNTWKYVNNHKIIIQTSSIIEMLQDILSYSQSNKSE